MKLLLPVILMIALMPGMNSAREHNSSLGFIINIPDHWLVMSPDAVQGNNEFTSEAEKKMNAINKELTNQVMAAISKGNIEFYFNMDTMTKAFSDNINVTRNTGQIPKNKSEMKSQCDVLVDMLPKYFKHPVTLHQCKLDTVGGRKAFVSEFDGVIPDTRSISYQVEAEPTKLYVITATTKNATLDSVRKDFKVMLNSIKFK